MATAIPSAIPTAIPSANTAGDAMRASLSSYSLNHPATEVKVKASAVQADTDEKKAPLALDADEKDEKKTKGMVRELSTFSDKELQKPFKLIASEKGEKATFCINLKDAMLSVLVHTSLDADKEAEELNLPRIKTVKTCVCVCVYV